MSDNAQLIQKHAEWIFGSDRRCLTAHRVDPGNSQRILNVVYRAGTNTREFERMEIEKMLSEQLIEPAQMKLGAPIVFASKMDGL